MRPIVSIAVLALLLASAACGAEDEAGVQADAEPPASETVQTPTIDTTPPPTTSAPAAASPVEQGVAAIGGTVLTDVRLGAAPPEAGPALDGSRAAGWLFARSSMPSEAGPRLQGDWEASRLAVWLRQHRDELGLGDALTPAGWTVVASVAGGAPDNHLELALGSNLGEVAPVAREAIEPEVRSALEARGATLNELRVVGADEAVVLDVTVGDVDAYLADHAQYFWDVVGRLGHPAFLTARDGSGAVLQLGSISPDAAYGAGWTRPDLRAQGQAGSQGGQTTANP